jgi:uncharacterized protein
MSTDARNLLDMRLTIGDRVLADDVAWASSHPARARGLIGRSPLRAGQALVLDGARQVHTFGMRTPIDVLFCDDSWSVLHVIRSMKPLRVSRWVLRARYVIEMPSGSSSAVGQGDRIVVTEDS